MDSSFQSTLPRGERQFWQYQKYDSNKFQSTLPRGERHGSSIIKDHSLNFNPRSREGSDAFRIFTPPCSLIFQSTLPRGERQVLLDQAGDDRNISIHAPARGATYSVPGSADRSKISIHAPARGATTFVSFLYFMVHISIHAPARGATENRKPEA